MNQKLYDGCEPLYQPAWNHGIKYLEPTGRSSKTGWFRRSTETQYCQAGHTWLPIIRSSVAEVLDVSVQDLVTWENATDQLAEEEVRAEDGGW